MSKHERAGQPAMQENLVNISELKKAFYSVAPDPSVKSQKVAFGTSGHRGVSFNASFNENHILAVTQAVCEYRKSQGIDGPMFIGADTHALSEPSRIVAVEVCAANGVEVRYEEGFTPTPVISHAILTYNKGRSEHMGDGIVITPSHNPPDSGGFKYNPPNGGPADTDATSWIENRANELLADKLKGVKRTAFEQAKNQSNVQIHDFLNPYINDLENVIDMNAIKGASLKIGADPMGGASVGYWEPIAEKYKLNLHLVNPSVDPTFSFMTLDHDGKIRMDCSSPYAMASLISLKDRYDIAFGNDPDLIDTELLHRTV